MTQEMRFSRIAVTADDEDDFVIEAGAKPAEEEVFDVLEAAPAEVAVPAEAEVAFADAAPAAEAALEAEALAAEALAAEAVEAGAVAIASAAAEAKPATPAQSPSASRSSGHHETTLEDLDSVKMSGVQKGVIAIAVVAVVAFVAYYLLFM